MNGVRRLLGAATGTSPPSPDKDSPPIQTIPTISSSPASLPSAKNTQGPNWPPSSTLSASPKQSTLGESIQSTAAYLLGKKDKGRQVTAEEVLVAIESPYSTTRPLNGLDTSSPGQNVRHSPSPSRTNASNGLHPNPSSPVTPQNKLVTHKSVNKLNGDLEVKRSSGLANIRDELLFSLLASDAVVDSREFTVLTSEEVEELKKEQHVLNARLVAAKKKLGLETKIRDAAISLSKVNASHRTVSNQTDKQLENVNKRVDDAQKDFWSTSERVNEVHRRLMEHRAAVLSFSLRNMEKKMSPAVASSYDSGYDSNRSTMISPTSTSVTGTSVGSSKPRFEGAHFFAGHSDAIIPKKNLSPEAVNLEIAALETKLNTVTKALSNASKQQAELARELSMARLEKQEVAAIAALDLESAEETISALQKDLPRLEGLGAEVQGLLKEKQEWERERSRLEEKNRQFEGMQARMTDLEARSAEAAGAERVLAEVREESQRHLELKQRELEDVRRQWVREREQWEMEKVAWEQAKEDDMQLLRNEMEKRRGEDDDALQRINLELNEGLAALQRLVREHGIVLFTRESSLKGLLDAVSSQLQAVHSKIEDYKQAEVDWSVTKKRLEEDVRTGLDKRELMARQLEEARLERDLAKKEAARVLQDQRDSMRSPIVPVRPSLPEINISPDADVNKLINILLPIWTILPSPEARAAKFGTTVPRAYHAGSSGSSRGTRRGGGSLSDLDVRTLKSLYHGSRDEAPGSPLSPSVSGVFSIEAFAQRVQALIADDKALIERLVRFAQAHDLLKKNAERAQKLAQDGSSAMETYQKQVRMLEERNQELRSRMAAMEEEYQLLHEKIEQLATEKREIESLAVDQAETCRQLTDANNTLSARTLTLAEESASASEIAKKQLEAQINELKKALEKAEAEVEDMKISGNAQRAALFEEMNTMHEENANLRAQLRAVKK